MPQRFFSIGDIHGHHKTLKALVETKLNVVSGDTVVFLGDYIDRGPSSKSVIDYILSLSQSGVRVIALAGNHEAMFLDYLEKNEKQNVLEDTHQLKPYLSSGESFVLSANGGFATLTEYEEEFPDSHREFFKTLRVFHLEPDWFDGKGVLFVHAGLSSESLDERSLDEAVRKEAMMHEKALTEARLQGKYCDSRAFLWHRHHLHNPVCSKGLIVHGHWSRGFILAYYSELLEHFSGSTDMRKWLLGFVQELAKTVNNPEPVNYHLSIDTGIVRRDNGGHICAVEFINGHPANVFLQEDVDGEH
jgi:UDP-2,3-diacylglucosamine pyrophosphatase LpxH